MLFPSTARRLEDGRWLARVEAWVHELERRPGASRLLARYIGLDMSELSLVERARYMTRTQLFRVDSERGRVVQIQFGAQPPLKLPASDANGRVSAEVAVAAEQGHAGWLDYRVVLAERAAHRFVGRALAPPPTGLSVVSDIDDTIKHTQVADRREMLLNTFAREFAAVPGMAQWMQRCAMGVSSAAFHYVSGGPHHLYPALAHFLQANGFPPGSVHLRTVDISREIFGTESPTRTHKLAVIHRLLEDFPERRFVLVGDSGEHDPEIYGELARAHSHRIDAVLIRDVTGEGSEAPRYATAFRQLAPSSWVIFKAADQLRTSF